MNLPGHTGLTLGAFLAVGYVGDALLAHSHRVQTSNLLWSKGIARALYTTPGIFQRLRLDYRVVLAGSLLPDVIDKPLGLFLLPQLLDFNGRTIGHSLVFNLGLLLIGLVLLRVIRSPTPLVLGVSSAGHLALDQMWQVPETLLWPLWGWRFPPGLPSLDDWLMFQLTGQWLSIPEVVGLAVLAGFAVQIYRLRGVREFLKTGLVGVLPRRDSVLTRESRGGD